MLQPIAPRKTLALRTLGPRPHACKAFSATTGLDVLTGTAGNDTFVGTLDATAGKSTINVGDSVDGAAGTADTFKLMSNVAAASNNNTGLTLTNVEKVEISNLVAGAANLHTFNAANASGVQEIAATSIGDLTVTNIGTAALGARGFVSNNGAVQALTAVGANTLNLGGVSVGTAAGSALNVDISGGAAGKAQAVVVNSTGAANTISDLKIGNTTDGASSLTINAATNFKTSTVTELAANKLQTITASGAATTVDIGTIASTALKSVDASGLTAGGIKVGIGANPATTFKGGVGNDTVTIAGAAVMTGAIDGGAGTDTLALSTAASLTSVTGKLFTNFETLQVSNAGLVGTTETYDPTFISGITSFKVAASSGAVGLTNLAAAPSVTVTGNVAGTAGLALTLKDATGTSDVVNITLDNGKTDATITNNGITVSKLTAANVETINIHSNGLITGAGATANTITANDVAANLTLSKVNIDGSQAFSFATGNNAVALTVDASAATGNGTIDSTGATKLVNINGGLGNDTITAGGAGGQVSGGKGGDAITLGTGTDILVFKAASDSVQDFTGTAGVAGKGTMDTITGFATGTDKIDLTSLNFTTATTKVFVDKTFADTAALTTGEAAATFFQDATNITRGAVVAHIGGDSYLVVDADHSGTFNAATDLVVKLAGTAALAQTDVIWG